MSIQRLLTTHPSRLKPQVSLWRCQLKLTFTFGEYRHKKPRFHCRRTDRHFVSAVMAADETYGFSLVVAAVRFLLALGPIETYGGGI